MASSMSSMIFSFACRILLYIYKGYYTVGPGMIEVNPKI